MDHLQKMGQVMTHFSCRKMVDERTRQIFEKTAEKVRQESERMDSKKQSSEKICQKERERQEKAETWKHSRIEAMRERRTQYEEMENSYERAAQEQESQRLVRVLKSLPVKEIEIPRGRRVQRVNRYPWGIFLSCQLTVLFLIS